MKSSNKTLVKLLNQKQNQLWKKILLARVGNNRFKSSFVLKIASAAIIEQAPIFLIYVFVFKVWYQLFKFFSTRIQIPALYNVLLTVKVFKDGPNGKRGCLVTVRLQVWLLFVNKFERSEKNTNFSQLIALRSFQPVMDTLPTIE